MERLSTINFHDTIASSFAESIAATQALAADRDLLHQVEDLAMMISASLRQGGKALFFGNGGSAADAMHLAAEFVGRFRLDRQPLPAMSLTDNVSAVSAIGNDYAFEEIFVRPILAFGAPGDVAIGLSTSGGSANVLAGLDVARQIGMHAVAITGADGLARPEVADTCLCMPAIETARVQECTMLVGHAVCEVVEQALAS
jgi:D-sedoheptulose 7-phosphate isomerase